MSIANSTFANNEDLKNDVGDALIYYDDQVKKLSRVNIVKSNFTLSWVYNNGNEIEVEVIIENSEFSHNTAQYGGGVYMYINNRSGSIEFSVCTIYNNIAQYGGEGVSIELCNGSVIIEFINCSIYNNTAYYGSGLIINALECTSTSSIHFKNVSFQFNKLPKKLKHISIHLIYLIYYYICKKILVLMVEALVYMDSLNWC